MTPHVPNCERSEPAASAARQKEKSARARASLPGPGIKPVEPANRRSRSGGAEGFGGAEFEVPQIKPVAAEPTPIRPELAAEPANSWPDRLEQAAANKPRPEHEKICKHRNPEIPDEVEQITK